MSLCGLEENVTEVMADVKGGTICCEDAFVIPHQEVAMNMLHSSLMWGKGRKINFIHCPPCILTVVDMCGFCYPALSSGSGIHIPVILLCGNFPCPL